MDREGRVIPRMRDKFKQINRFLELIDDVAGSLPTGRPLEIVDLCCGKSYLTFAVHHYFSVIKHREVHVTGVDLKADVIARCNAVAENLGLHGLTFLHPAEKITRFYRDPETGLPSGYGYQPPRLQHRHRHRAGGRGAVGL